MGWRLAFKLGEWIESSPEIERLGFVPTKVQEVPQGLGH